MGNTQSNPYDNPNFKIVRKNRPPSRNPRKQTRIVPTKEHIVRTPIQNRNPQIERQLSVRTYQNRVKNNEQINSRLQENIMVRKNIEKEIEDEYNPFDILQMNQTNDIKTVKKQYKKLALQNHPDKGGNPDNFDKITKAYVYIVKLLDIKTPDKQMDLINKGKEIEREQYENIHFNKKNFSNTRFNDMFTKFKRKDYNDDGYGKEMNNESIDDIKNIINKSKMSGKKFSAELFNSMFTEENNNDESKMIIYDEPSELISGNLQFTELDNRQINDFGSFKDIRNTRNNLNFMDYKKAHKKSKLINENVKFKQYKNINELKSERSNINYKLSNEDKEKIKIKKRKQQEYDEQRKQRLREYDNEWENQFNRINKIVIKN